MKFQHPFNRHSIPVVILTFISSIGLSIQPAFAQTAAPTAAPTAAATASGTAPVALQQQLLVKTGKVEVILSDGSTLTVDVTTPSSPTASLLPPKAPDGAVPTPLALPATAPINIALDANTHLPVLTISENETINTNILGGGTAELDTVIPATNNTTSTFTVAINPGSVVIIQQAETNPTTGMTNVGYFSPVGASTITVPATGMLTNTIQYATLLGSVKVDAQNGSTSTTQVLLPATGVEVDEVVNAGSANVKSIADQVKTLTVASGAQPTGTQLVATLPASDLGGAGLSALPSAMVSFERTGLQTGGNLGALIGLLKKYLTVTSLTPDQINLIAQAIQKAATSPLTVVVVPLVPALKTLLGSLTSGAPTQDQLQFLQQVVLAGSQCTAPTASGVGGVVCS